jgi:hypothetical protein
VKEITMNLSRPTRNVFYISVILVVLSLLGRFAGVSALAQYEYWLLLIGYILLLLGVTQKGF